MTELDADMLAKAIPAQGPDGLSQVLEDLLEKAQAGSGENKEFIILYQLGQQKSVIKVDFNQQPCHFWYHDFLGRPMTKAVENTIAEFLWTKCGERERYSHEASSKESL